MKTDSATPPEGDNRFYEKWTACRNAAESAGVRLPDTPSFLAEARKVFSFSEFVVRNCIRNPSLLADLYESGDLGRAYAADEYDRRVADACREAPDEVQLGSRLRRLRTREMVRIAWRDLSGAADLFETMESLSSFADACTDYALSFLYPRMCESFGVPTGPNDTRQRLVVIGMGKLGGRELNFSSDIDLIFAYPEPGETVGTEQPIENDAFFTRLCRRLIDVLGKNTADGFLFRVDTRLRPYGDGGPLVMSFDAMENYYQGFGREWERYALIKARVIAGDKSAGRVLLEHLKPFVFRRYLDYGSFESLREMKRKITREVARKGMKENIKHGAGGIREIEFFGQMFQLIRGGVEPSYQVPGILQVLEVLANERCIPESVYEELTSAYIFLRNTEHRLQMADDMQTHTLPSSKPDRSRLARAMGYENWEAFSDRLRHHMARVHSHFSELLSPEAGEADAEAAGTKDIEGVWQNPGDRERNIRILAAAGFEHPGETAAVLENFHATVDTKGIQEIGRERIDRLMPLLLTCVGASDHPDKVLKRIIPLMESILKRSSYISLLIENPGALRHLVQLARISLLIVSFLTHHPLLLDELLDARLFNEPLDRAALSEDLQWRLASVEKDDLELQMDALRVFKQVNTFRIAVADVNGYVPLMKVSDRLTYLAETVVAETMELAWRHLESRYGRPSHLSDAGGGDRGFAVIAYGKLGGFELGYGSDLDMVFLHTAKGGETSGGSARPISNAEFYARLGQRIIHFLSAQTSTGKLYEADMRLRPSGNSGVLVSHIDAYAEYQSNDAWTWEHQALIKARPVYGDREVTERFGEIRKGILTLSRQPDKLREEVINMRERMRKAHGPAPAGRFDIKQDTGGIIDIEFFVQYLILLHARHHEQLVRWTDVVRQLNALALSGIIEDRAAYTLKQAYLVYRYCVHRRNLQNQSAVLPEKPFAQWRRRVTQIWDQYLGPAGQERR